MEVTKGYLNEGPQYFPDDMISDHGEQFQIAEIIREKVLYKTEEEVPHSVAVVIEKGWHGYTGAPVAKAIFDEYFSLNATPAQVPPKGELLP